MGREQTKRTSQGKEKGQEHSPLFSWRTQPPCERHEENAPGGLSVEVTGGKAAALGSLMWLLSQGIDLFKQVEPSGHRMGQQPQEEPETEEEPRITTY